MSTETELIDRQEKMKSARAQFERQWHEIGMRVLPRTDDFINKAVEGARRDQYVFDSTAPLALESFGAAMESLLTPRTQKWHGLAPSAPKIKRNKRVNVWLEQLRDTMFRVRYAPYANFASQLQETYLSLGAYGTGVVFVEDALSRGICYHAIPLAEAFIAQNAQGRVDTMFRRYELTVRQATQRWGNALPEAVAKHLDKEPERKFEFIHAVMPNEERKVGMKNYRGMECAAFDISIEGKALLAHGGFRKMPYAVSRYVTSAREVYGRSPAQTALADIRMINEQSKTMMRIGQLIADNPILTSDVDALSPFSTRPGAINAGYLNERGEPMARRMDPPGDPRITFEMQTQRRESINRAFLVTLFQILVDTPQMTATEVMQRAQEKGALLAPTGGRQQSELLGPIIERELDILGHAGVIQDVPPELREHNDIEVQYDGPLSRAMMADEGMGILRTFEAVKPLADVDPRVLKRFDFDAAAQILARVNGAPAAIVFSDEEMARRNAADAQQQQLQQAAQVAPQLSEAAKNIAQAHQIATQAPF